MPRSYTSNDETRETKTIHAAWWSPKMTTDGKLSSPSVDEGGVYVERCVIFARLLSVDEDMVQKRSYSSVDKPKAGQQKVDISQIAKAPAYTLQQMVVELTDDEGTPAPLLNIVGKRPMLSEVFIRGMELRDREFILGEIDKLKEEPVPVTEKDEEEANRRNAMRQDRLDRGFALHTIEPHLREEVTAEGVAQDMFRPDR